MAISILKNTSGNRTPTNGSYQREGVSLTRVCSAELCLEGRQRGAEVEGEECLMWSTPGCRVRPSHDNVAQQIKEVVLKQKEVNLSSYFFIS